jgi:hypothetical protein
MIRWKSTVDEGVPQTTLDIIVTSMSDEMALNSVFVMKDIRSKTLVKNYFEM